MEEVLRWMRGFPGLWQEHIQSSQLLTSDRTFSETDEFMLKIIIEGPKATVAEWGNLNKTIITGHDDGTITVWDAEV